MVGPTRFELVTFCTPSNLDNTIKPNKYGIFFRSFGNVPRFVPHFAIDFRPVSVIYCCVLANGVKSNNAATAANTGAATIVKRWC